MKKIIYKLTLEEPVLATKPGSDPNTEISHDHIPGSVIRGALASRYLLNGGNTDDTFTRLFLNGKTRYLNAYPAVEDKRALPIPHSWQQEKDPPKTKNVKDERRIYDFVFKDKRWPKAMKRLSGSFFHEERGTVQAVKTKYEIAVHNARNRAAGRAIENDTDSALFRYQALAREQTFIGAIVVEADDDAVTVSEWLQEAKLLVGGSHSAGYGLVTLEELSPEDESDTDAKAITANDPFIIYLTSDAILRHSTTGQPGADIADALQTYFPNGCQIEVKSAYSRMTWVGGFNNKWGLPLPQTWAVQKGSVWQITANVAIPAEIIRKLESGGIGDRRAEGFGQLLVNPDRIDSQKVFYLPPENDEDEKQTGEARENLSFPDLDGADDALVNQMNARLAEQTLDRLLLAAAQKNVKSYRGILSQSQLGRLRLRIREALNAPGVDLAGFAAYLDGTKARKSADEPFRKASIKRADGRRQNFRAWMRELAGHPPHVWEQIGVAAEGSQWQKGKEGWERPFLGQSPFTLDEKRTRRYAARLIESVCMQISRGGRS